MPLGRRPPGSGSQLDSIGVTPTGVTAPPEQLLRERGLKVTASRIAVLRAIDGAGGHPDAAAIAAHARGALGSISTQAVYDGLGALVGAGLVRRIEPAGSPARYETRVGDNHHHLVCRVCGRTEDVDCATGAAPCLEPGDDLGFAVDEAEVIFWGRCADCRAAAAS
jgi:Fur family transcriptional regulator, stress-responsive regulator